MIYNEENRLIWPPVRYEIVSNEGRMNIISPLNHKILQSPKGEPLYSFVFKENIQSFMQQEYSNKNFFELMKYAIANGEEKEVWQKALDSTLEENIVRTIRLLENDNPKDMKTVLRKLKDYNITEEVNGN